MTTLILLELSLYSPNFLPSKNKFSSAIALIPSILLKLLLSDLESKKSGWKFKAVVALGRTKACSSCRLSS